MGRVLDEPTTGLSRRVCLTVTSTRSQSVCGAEQPAVHPICIGRQKIPTAANSPLVGLSA